MAIAREAPTRRDRIRQNSSPASAGGKASSLHVDPDKAMRGPNEQRKWMNAGAEVIALVVIAIILYVTVLAAPTGTSPSSHGMDILRYLFGR